MAEVNKAQIGEWHEEGLKVVSDYKRCESRIVFLLSKLSESHGYLLYKSDSLHQYATCVWGLSDHAAKDFVTVANKAIEIPALLEALESKLTTVSKLRKICPVININNYKEWIALAIECSARMVERAVAMENPEAAAEIRDQIKYKAENRVEMKAGLSEHVMHKFRRVQDLVSQQMRKPASFEEAFEACFDQYLEKHDPIKKAERAMAREVKREAKVRKAKEANKDASKKDGMSAERDTAGIPAEQNNEPSNERVELTLAEQIANQVNAVLRKEDVVIARASTQAATIAAEPKKSVTCRVLSEGALKPKGRRKKISANIKHTITLRDGDQCTATGPGGERCMNRRWLDTHHIIPLSEGGTDELENLTTLCSGHHRAHHFAEALGSVKQSELRH